MTSSRITSWPADFTIHAAGPYCTHLLSQHGAECIKIESRTRPDAFRKPHAVYGRMSAATFDQVSANKLSVRLNLKQPEAVVLAKRLVGVSDLAAESFRPGVMNRLGLGARAGLRADPEMQMNPYQLSELAFLLQSAGIPGFQAQFTDHGGELGVFLFFKKPAAAPAAP